MIDDCTGVPPGESMSRIMPSAFLSVNASCKMGMVSSAEKLLPGAIMPSKRIKATYFPLVLRLATVELGTKRRKEEMLTKVMSKNQATNRIFFQRRSARLSFNKSRTKEAEE